MEEDENGRKRAMGIENDHISVEASDNLDNLTLYVPLYDCFSHELRYRLT